MGRNCKKQVASAWQRGGPELHVALGMADDPARYLLGKGHASQLWNAVLEAVLQMPQTSWKMSRWVLLQSEPETLLEAQMTQLKLSCLRHIMRRQGFFLFLFYLERTIMLGQIEDSRKRERLKRWWLDSIKKAMDLSHRSWAGLLGTGHCEHHHSLRRCQDGEPTYQHRTRAGVQSPNSNGDVD